MKILKEKDSQIEDGVAAAEVFAFIKSVEFAEWSKK
jgi:hypothetical protein